MPRNIEVVTDYCTLAPGTAEVVADLRARRMKIG